MRNHCSGRDNNNRDEKMTAQYDTFNLPKSFHTLSVPGNTKIVMYKFRIPAGGVGFITNVGMTIPNSNCKITFLIDGDSVEEGSFTYQPGKINEPLKFDPPLTVRRDFMFIAINDGSSTETFEVVCHGLYHIRR